MKILRGQEMSLSCEGSDQPPLNCAACGGRSERLPFSSDASHDRCGSAMMKHLNNASLGARRKSQLDRQRAVASPRRMKGLCLAALGQALVLAVPSSVHAAQTDVTISMDPPPAMPRINGPRILGWLPQTPFLYSVPATGQAPLSYAASGLPDGLSIDESTGIINGTTPAVGSFPIRVTVTNAAGTAQANLSLVVGDTLALTPPMGWNSYDSFYEKVTEQDMMAAATAMKEVLQPYGWNTVVVDYLWYDPQQIIDDNGRWLPSTSKFPNANGANGFAPLAENVHDLGLSFGIHLMRGIPRKSFTANTPILNSAYTAQAAGNSKDICAWDDHMYGVRGDTPEGQAWYDSIYSQYADWGVDFVKVDDMMDPYAPGKPTHTSEVKAVHNSLYQSGRSIVLSLSPGPHQTSDVAVLNANANMWRTVNDFWDTNGLSTIGDEFDTAHDWAETDGITPGHWPDADMLPLGTIGNRPCAFTHNQQVTVMTLWSMMPSPLMFGGMPIKLAADAWTTALLTNEEVLAVNQDALGSRGKGIASQGSTEIWARDLSGGRKAVAFFNRGTEDAEMNLSFAELGFTEVPVVRDLWHKMDVGSATTELAVTVPHEAALMYTLTPADYEDPDLAGGTGGAAGSGGNDAVGGTTGTGGGITASAGGAAAGTGGASGSPGAGGGATSAGGSGQTGSGGSADGTSGGGSSATGKDESGCSCRLASPRPATNLWSFAGAALLLLARRRRHTS